MAIDMGFQRLGNVGRRPGRYAPSHSLTDWTLNPSIVDDLEYALDHDCVPNLAMTVCETLNNLPMLRVLSPAANLAWASWR